MDLDGTLLDSKKGVSLINVQALRDCEARGIRAVLASGRTFESIQCMAREMGLKSPIISSNGARVDESPKGPVLMEDVFERALAQRVYRVMKRSGVYFVIYGPGRIYQVNLNENPEENRGLSKSGMRVGAELRGGAQVEVVRDEARALEEGLERAYKFVAFCRQTARLDSLGEALRRETNCSLSSSWYDNLEVLAPGGGKGRALFFLMEKYGLRRDQVMAFGDNLNDLDMLRAAGVPVAMENAAMPLKAIAHLIAPHHDRSGVGRVINELVLGGEP